MSVDTLEPPAHVESPTWRCGTCQFELWVPVRDLRVSHVGLYDDARFPGRCLLALNDHHEDVTELEAGVLQEMMLDLRDLTRAVKRVTGAPRINVAVLGNAVPHVHWHAVPRLPDREMLPSRSPWDDPRPRTGLAPAEMQRLRRTLVEELERDG